MKLEFNRNPDLKTFDELKVGQTFFTSDGDIGVRTSYSYKGDNCMYYSTLNKDWCSYCENGDTTVEVIESTLSIDSYEREIKR